MLGNFDPVAIGLVKSLGKPEANVTGVLIAPAGTLAGKKLELLKEAVPSATRVAFLTHEDPGRELAARYRLPAIYEWPEQVDDGGFMSYGGDLGRTTRRLAEYVDRILKGARPDGAGHGAERSAVPRRAGGSHRRMTGNRRRS
jgi:ABC-type uncharacterized transport system substrate-binding protein